MIVMNPLECPNCGAPLENNSLHCVYCGTRFERSEKLVPRKKRPRQIQSVFNQPPGVREFGVSSNALIKIGAIISFVLYLFGWFFEDTDYWLDEKAMIIWVGILPLWLFGVAFFWRTIRKVAFLGLVFSVVEFIVHISVILVIRGNLWDDHVGIAAMVAGASLIGWLLGRLTHGIIRSRRA